MSTRGPVHTPGDTEPGVRPADAVTLPAASIPRPGSTDDPIGAGSGQSGVDQLSRRRTWTAEQIRRLGVSTDLITAASVLGIGRTKAHELARAGRFPVPVLRYGRRYRVPTAPILELLHITPVAETEQTGTT